MKPSVILLATALLACGGATAADMPATSSSQGINVAAEGLKRTALFKNWKVSLDTPGKIGTFESGFFCSKKGDIAYTKGFDQ